MAISTLARSVFEGHLLQLKPNRTVVIVETFELPGDATCLCLSSFLGSPYIIAGLMVSGSPSLLLYHVKEGANSQAVLIDPGSGTSRTVDFCAFVVP